MTKKAMNIYEKYCDKLNTEKLLYTTNFIQFEELQKRLNKIQDDFQSMVTQMYHYNLLSYNDFHELFMKAYPTQAKIIDDILQIS